MISNQPSALSLFSVAQQLQEQVGLSQTKKVKVSQHQFLPYYNYVCIIYGSRFENPERVVEEESPPQHYRNLAQNYATLGRLRTAASSSYISFNPRKAQQHGLRPSIHSISHEYIRRHVVGLKTLTKKLYDVVVYSSSRGLVPLPSIYKCTHRS